MPCWLPFGEHDAVQRNEIGDPTLKAEEARNIDLSLNFENDLIYGSINFYQNEVDNYIYRKDSGVKGSGEMKLEIANFVQKDAELDGYEIKFGTDFVVIGREITQAENPEGVLKKIESLIV